MGIKIFLHIIERVYIDIFLDTDKWDWTTKRSLAWGDTVTTTKSSSRSGSTMGMTPEGLQHLHIRADTIDWR